MALDAFLNSWIPFSRNFPSSGRLERTKKNSRPTSIRTREASGYGYLHQDRDEMEELVHLAG